MDIVNLLHSLTVAGLTLRAGAGGSLEVVGDVSRVNQAQREALKTHKPALLVMLGPPPTCYVIEEREAIRWESDPTKQGEVSKALAEALEFFEGIIDEREPEPKDPRPQEPPRHFDELKAAHNAKGIDLLTLEPMPSETPCHRCGSRQSYLAIIHGGESLRRDCASCGRFREFAAWKEKAKAEQILTDLTEQARYNAKAGCSSAGTLKQP
jgi:hypothetical protein